jgi:dethiobiotin synthetase
MKAGFFVTGTDTGVGKTLISSALVCAFAQGGFNAAGMKPVAAGCRWEGGRLLSDDVEQLRAASNVLLDPDTLNPYAFEPPLAPRIAANRVGNFIDLGRIRNAFESAAARVDVLVVEGVGGFRVPLNEAEDTADLAVMLGLPVILVVGMRLGCQNHALLTAEAIAARSLRLAGWVANCIDAEMAALEDNLAALQHSLRAPCLGVVPFSAFPDFRAVVDMIDCTDLMPSQRQ